MIKRMRGKAFAVSAAVVGALALGASPAAAADTWQPWVAGADYKCGDSTKHLFSKNIGIQTCIFRAPGSNSFQAVAVAVNNSPNTVYLETAVFNKTTNTVDNCAKRKVAPGERVACYGTTKSTSVRPVKGDAYIWLNDGLSDLTLTAEYK
ncbi:hypothetical protein ACFYVL_42600 [Streptomyces sp. NPDC004111]|uniref:hypothetical protein n=1 Tax=Streptomyces sp. NPDC004111 TaxID=3364690 RepID=UPI0036AF3828